MKYQTEIQMRIEDVVTDRLGYRPSNELGLSDSRYLTHDGQRDAATLRAHLGAMDFVCSGEGPILSELELYKWQMDFIREQSEEGPKVYRRYFRTRRQVNKALSAADKDPAYKQQEMDRLLRLTNMCALRIALADIEEGKPVSAYVV